MQTPEETRELKDVTIRARETSPGRFEANFRPTSPTHPARHGFTVDTGAGLAGRPWPKSSTGPSATGARTTPPSDGVEAAQQLGQLCSRCVGADTRYGADREARSLIWRGIERVRTDHVRQSRYGVPRATERVVSPRVAGCAVWAPGCV